jgi:hypothetical protein
MRKGIRKFGVEMRRLRSPQAAGEVFPLVSLVTICSVCRCSACEDADLSVEGERATSLG